jgi:hypothetical protein
LEELSVIGKLTKAGMLLGLCCACGTQVEVGRNSQPNLFAGAEDSFASDGNGQTFSADGLALSCYGEASQDQVPSSVLEFCSELSPEVSSEFALAYKYLCETREVANMTRAQCAWNGEGEASSFLKVISYTDLDDTANKEFSYLSAGSVLIPRAAQEYLTAFYRGYDDPEFKSKLKALDGFVLSDVSVDRQAGTVDYTVEAKTSAAVAKFTGHIDVLKSESGIIAMFDRAVKNKVLVVENRYLLLIVPIDQDYSVVLAIDDKVVNDMGNHRIAFNTSVDLNKARMELTHAAANYQGEE